MKTTVKQLATGTFIALLLLVLNAKAEGTEAKALKAVNIETTLLLENWMMDEKLWNSANTFEFIQETETDIIIENWMTNELVWDTNNAFVEETEAEMELESWMTYEKTWNSKDIAIETELSLENWMIDSEVWN